MDKLSLTITVHFGQIACDCRAALLKYAPLDQFERAVGGTQLESEGFEVGRYLAQDPWRNPELRQQRHSRETPKGSVAEELTGAAAAAPGAAVAAAEKQVAAERQVAAGRQVEEDAAALLLRAAVADATASAAALEQHLTALLQAT